MKLQNLIHILSAIACFALLPRVQALTPPPDGGYPGANTAEGQNALFSLTTGGFNTAVGYFSLRSNTKGELNTAIGAGALLVNVGNPNGNEGIENTATGAGALLSNTTGPANTADGVFTLFSNTTGSYNTANGFNALSGNTTGDQNTANGVNTLFSNSTGSFNTASGAGALTFNTTGSQNTANGLDTLAENTTGSFNTATGTEALSGNTTGSSNTATGAGALVGNSTGILNTANGWGALSDNSTGSYNTAIGDSALAHTTGNVNVAVGDFAGGNLTGGSYNIEIGNPGETTDDHTTRIGLGQTGAFIAGIFGTNVSGSTVVVTSDGQLGVAASSRRFKKEIQPMDKASEAILALKPVTFHYKSDPAGAGPQFGLIAEEVAKVNPDLVARDKDGQIYTVRYDAVNTMLLNEFLKEHREVRELGKQLQKLAADLQKVSDRLEVRRPAPPIVDNR